MGNLRRVKGAEGGRGGRGSRGRNISSFLFFTL
jgi:hypothetical protein